MADGGGYFVMLDLLNEEDAMRIKADVAVFGAGSSGSAVAWNLARSGRKVVLLEKRALDKSGARWINGIPA